MESHARRQTRPAHTVTGYLTSLGILCSWCAYVVLALNTEPAAYNLSVEPQSKPALYYLLHGLGIASVMAGGMYAMCHGSYRRLSLPTRAAFWLLLISCLTWAAVSYNLSDYLSWKALGSTGPLVWLSCVLIFSGMDRNVWRVVDPLVHGLSYLTAVLLLVALKTNYAYVTERWFSAPVQYMVLLMWFAGWTLLTSWNCTGAGAWLRRFPYLAFILAAIVTQTRSWCLMALLLLLGMFYVTRSTSAHKAVSLGKVVLNASLITAALIITFLAFQDFFLEALGRLGDRAFEDSRTGQYVEFFHQVAPADLLWGEGPNASWSFGTTEGFKEYQYFDNAYLWMAFLGGLPLVVSYITVIVLPGVKLFLKGVAGNDAAAAILIALWGLACTGLSTYTLPSLTPYSYFICLLAGRCLATLAERRDSVAFHRNGSRCLAGRDLPDQALS